MEIVINHSAAPAIFNLSYLYYLKTLCFVLNQENVIKSIIYVHLFIIHHTSLLAIKHYTIYELVILSITS